jgi:oligogalacturonide transport system permease protein
VGLKNYIDLFTIDRDFLLSLKATLLYTLMTVPGKLILALVIAVLMNRKSKGINFIRTLYYIPSLFGGSVAVALLWKIMFMDNGIINSLISKMGLPSVTWLGDPNTALPTICMLEIWQFGSSMVMFLAALKQVPASLYEAASIDGAGKAKQFFSITIPQITPIIFFNMIMQTIQALQNFTSAMVVTNGGPLKATYVLGMKLYNEGFSYFRMGYASAISWIVFLLIMVVTSLLFKSSSAWVFYEND